jgi:hypothetical protein
VEKEVCRVVVRHTSDPELTMAAAVEADAYYDLVYAAGEKSFEATSEGVGAPTVKVSVNYSECTFNAQVGKDLQLLDREYLNFTGPEGRVAVFFECGVED